MIKVVNSVRADVEGFDVKQAFPNNEIRFLNPFILLHHAKNFHKGGERQEDLGVPPHPHRGFTPVSIILQGSLHHRDSLGNSSVIHEGGVQWTESASGLVHSERPSKELAANGGILELIQLWVNLPAKDKMGKPQYFAWEKSEIPRFQDENKSISIISGRYKDTIGVAESKYYIDLLLVELNNSSNFEFDSALDTYIYMIEGEISINGARVSTHQTAILGEVSNIEILTNKKSKFLVMSGKDNGEVVAAAGPFVMNTMGDAKRSFLEYGEGKFGQLIEKFD